MSLDKAQCIEVSVLITEQGLIFVAETGWYIGRLADNADYDGIGSRETVKVREFDLIKP